MTPGIDLDWCQAQAGQLESHWMESDGGIEQNFAILFAHRGHPLRESLRATDKDIRFRARPRCLWIHLICQRENHEFKPFEIERPQPALDQSHPNRVQANISRDDTEPDPLSHWSLESRRFLAVEPTLHRLCTHLAILLQQCKVVFLLIGQKKRLYITNEEGAISIALDPPVFEPGKLTPESGAVRRVTSALRGKGRCPEHYACPARLCIAGIELDSPVEARHGAIVLSPAPITES